MSVRPVVSVTSGVHLTYDRISKCKNRNVAPPAPSDKGSKVTYAVRARLADGLGTRLSRPHDSTEWSLPRFTVYASATNYVATTDLQISAGGRDSLGNMAHVGVLLSGTV